LYFEVAMAQFYQKVKTFIGDVAGQQARYELASDPIKKIEFFFGCVDSKDNLRVGVMPLLKHLGEELGTADRRFLIQRAFIQEYRTGDHHSGEMTLWRYSRSDICPDYDKPLDEEEL